MKRFSVRAPQVLRPALAAGSILVVLSAADAKAAPSLEGWALMSAQTTADTQPLGSSQSRPRARRTFPS
jgi:hypothetical protein